MTTFYLTNNANNGLLDRVLDECRIVATKFTGITDLVRCVAEDGGKWQHVTHMIIDLTAITNNTDDEILKTIESMRHLYNFRIIIVAYGYEENNILLGRLFDLGIYNIAIGNNQMELEDNIRECFSKEGKNFKDSSMFKLPETPVPETPKTFALTI